MTPHHLAEIPVLDWTGPQFLSFYGVAYVAALFWSMLRRRNSLARFTVPGRPPVITDPYDAAYLAGGEPRCVQVAVATLLAGGAIRWGKSGWLKRNVLFAGAGTAPTRPVETALFVAAAGRGEKGLPLRQAHESVIPALGRIERNLASRGLRPTRQELHSTRYRNALPLFLLMGLGVVKFVLGLTRDKPVLFLVLALAVTVITIVVISSNIRDHLTPAGKEMLQLLRTSHSARPEASPPSTLPMAVALGGVAVLADYEHLFGSDPAFLKELEAIQPATSAGGAGGCGTSGCGSSGSGCGSGGCGGCGGDGD